MSISSPSHGPSVFQSQVLDAAIRIGLVLLLVLWSFNIVKPFILPVLWAAIIAVAIYPVFMKLQSMLGGRKKLAATLLTLFALALLITPTIMLSDSLISNSQKLADGMESGTLSIPAPADSVNDWPIVGEQVFSAWNLAATNLDQALIKFKPQLEAVAKWFLSSAAGVGGTILQFIVSIIIAGVLLVYAEGGEQIVHRVAGRLLGKAGGSKVADLAGATIRSVAQGVLGVALIQATLAAIGLIVMGVPYAGIWTLLVLLLAVVQLPPLLILGPVIIYVFTVAATVPAVLFMIWGLMVSMSDAFLKPLFLGRGMDIPMLVILLGAIGGMILSGIIGLFVGAVVLAVSYKLFVAWLDKEDEAEQTEAD